MSAFLFHQERPALLIGPALDRHIALGDEIDLSVFRSQTINSRLTMTSEPEFSTRSIAGHWHMIVKQGGGEERYPARSETEAEIMVRMEKRRRGLVE